MARISSAKKFCGLILCLMIVCSLDRLPAETSSPSTGIEGLIAIGPIRGGPVRRGETSSRPFANEAFEVTTTAGVVATFTTDASGEFRIALPPGRYSVQRKLQTRLPRCGPFEVEVTAEGFKKVQWGCDSGMR